MSKVAIIDYGAGNVKSIELALRRINAKSILTSNPEEITKADRVIFPGVGEASSAMKKLKQYNIDKILPNLKQPVLGICLGMQLMCNRSEEGKTPGLGIFNVNVVKFSKKNKVPQIGWNKINKLRSPLFKNIIPETYVYLVHSYFAKLCSNTCAESFYGLNYSSALYLKNFYGVQFHPEKSSKQGSKILKNFMKL